MKTTSDHGILGGPHQDFQLQRYPCSPDLASLVERHWATRWNLPPGAESSVTLLPHPCVNIVLDGGTLVVSGVGQGRFTRVLAGSGGGHGVKFRPGGFLPLLGSPVSELTGRVQPLSALWGADVTRLERTLTATGDRDGGLCSALEGGGVGPCWEGRQGPSRALGRWFCCSM